MQDLLNRLHQLEREMARARWDTAKARLALLRASPDAQRQGLPPALLDAEDAARKALPVHGKPYSHDIAKQALDEFEALLDRYAGWD